MNRPRIASSAPMGGIDPGIEPEILGRHPEARVGAFVTQGLREGADHLPAGTPVGDATVLASGRPAATWR